MLSLISDLVLVTFEAALYILKLIKFCVRGRYRANFYPLLNHEIRRAKLLSLFTVLIMLKFPKSFNHEHRFKLCRASFLLSLSQNIKAEAFKLEQISLVL